MKISPWAIAISGLILAIIFDLLFYKVHGLGINVFLIQLLFLSATIGLAMYARKELTTRVLVTGAFSLAFALVFAIWDSEASLVLSVFSLIISNVLFVAFLFGYSSNFIHPLGLVRVGFWSFIHLFEQFGIFKNLKIGKMGKNHTSIIAGIAISIPILLVFIYLFASADVVVFEYLSDLGRWLTDINGFEDFIGHIFLIGFFTFLFTHIFAAAFWNTVKVVGWNRKEEKWQIESSVIIGLLSILFGVFIIIQGFYLFGGEDAFRALDISVTYADYAKQGFGQLSAAAIIVILLILTLRYFHHEKADKLLNSLYTVLIAETGVVLASALVRLNLYKEAYGFTPVRLFSFWFMGVVAIILIMLLINIWMEKKQTAFMQKTLVFCGIAVLAFVILTPDLMAIRLQDQRNGFGYFDSRDFTILSSDAAAYVTKRLDEGVRVNNNYEMKDRISTDEWGAYIGSDDLPRYTATERWVAEKGTRYLCPNSQWRIWSFSKSKLNLSTIYYQDLREYEKRAFRSQCDLTVVEANKYFPKKTND